MPSNISNTPLSTSTLLHNTSAKYEMRGDNSPDSKGGAPITSKVNFVCNSKSNFSKTDNTTINDAAQSLNQVWHNLRTSDGKNYIGGNVSNEESVELTKVLSSQQYVDMQDQSLVCNAIVNVPPHTIIDMPEHNNSISNTNSTKLNDYQQLLLTHIKNMGMTLTRNLVSVGVPTAAREYVRRSALPALFDNIPQAARVSAGGIAIAMPIVLQLAGIIRDICAGTQTPESLSSRLAEIALVTGTGAALAATSGLSVAANALIAAVFVYVPLRDLSQYFLLLQDNNKGGVNFRASALSAAAYAGNQAAVDQGMEILANALEPTMGTLAANIVGRAIVNIGGETLDEFTNRGLHAYSSNNPRLEFGLGFRPTDEITQKTVFDSIFNTLAGRSSLFSSAYLGGYAAPVQGVLNSMVTGAVLGLGYIPFIYSHAQKSEESHNIIV